MAQAASASTPANQLQAAAQLGENKSRAARASQSLAPARPVGNLGTAPTPSQSQPATDTNQDPLAEQAGRQEQLQSRRQQKQAAVQQQKKQEQADTQQQQQAAQAGQAKGKFTRRDMVNDHIDRTMIATIAGFFTAIFALIWFNLKLIWGGLIMKNQSRWLSEPSMRPFKAHFLPKQVAYLAIIAVDVIIIVSIMIIVLVVLIAADMISGLANNALSFILG